MPQVPLADSDAYNIGYDVCDRHAGDPSRRALIYEDAAGQIQEYTFLEIMRRAKRLANALTRRAGARRSDRHPSAADSRDRHRSRRDLQDGRVAVPLLTLFGAEVRLVPGRLSSAIAMSPLTSRWVA